MAVHPEVLWAQRSSSSDSEKNYLYLTIGMPDVSKDSMKLDIKPTTIEASGHSATKNIDYATKLELFGEVDPEKTKTNHTARGLELVLFKKELKEEYWPRLLKEQGKVHFLRTDFDKWVDEDEQEGNPDDDDLMSKMGGMGAGGGGPGGFEGIDFSKLGAGPMGGAEDEEEEGDESDDDEDMPALEGEDSEAGAPGTKAAAGSSKIEEVE